jgi:pantoate--beta-alanine ligase
MGALHDGHRALLRRARQLALPTGAVVVSIFVNPLQFGPGEDFGRYPRTLDTDLAVCGEEGAAVVFAPDREQLYPAEPMVTVDPGPMGRLLEGRSRPGFFSGVLTVVLKLFQLVQPDMAVFGEKDAQQLALVRRMSADLDLGVEIVAEPTVRDSGGLAVSSRNAYLSGAERATALALSRALTAGRARAPGGRAGVLAAAQAVLAAAAAADPPLRPDYLALVDPATFDEAADGYQGPAILLVAGTAGSTRLIDNVPLLIGGPAVPSRASEAEGSPPCC